MGDVIVVAMRVDIKVGGRAFSITSRMTSFWASLLFFGLHMCDSAVELMNWSRRSVVIEDVSKVVGMVLMVVMVEATVVCWEMVCSPIAAASLFATMRIGSFWVLLDRNGRCGLRYTGSAEDMLVVAIVFAMHLG